MARLKALNPDEVSGKTKELFNAVQSKLGVVPNMMRTMGNSPAMLEGSLSLSNALGSGVLDGKTGVLISMAVAESNSCNYCLSAHSYVGANFLKIEKEVLESARKGNASNAKTDAILKFAKLLVSKRGAVSDSDVNSLKSAGASEGEIAEVIGHVGLNILTNYFNNTAKTEIDFPLIEAEQVAVV